MSTQPPSSTSPGLIPSLTAGFNTVANNIHLIIFPVFLDIFLWFGPCIRIKNLLTPWLDQLMISMAQISSPEMSDVREVAQEVWYAKLEHFNLLSALSSFPVGIPSLMSLSSPLENPLTKPFLFELTSFSNAFSLFILLSIGGLFLGSLFFHEVVRHISTTKPNFSFSVVVSQSLQTLMLSITLLVMLMVVSLPTGIVISVLTMFSPFLAQTFLWIVMFFLIWLLFPLFFSSYGIFVFRANFFASILRSVRFVRLTFTTSGLFFITTLLIVQGLSALWIAPQDSSWMKLVGILGHGFINTSILAASFIYYRNGTLWIEDIIQNRIIQQKN